ncbi:FbpB family small basic protein [Virgibacillus halodenitrificans]|uniref:FbpB family small basic protein n=1 Tax=Virgibacillus halodenitrificans TaxID=1482 RepID=A0ABR7VUH9_VIRHA|nr:FbpB family small basic protein [Virgibacillus halodenitrificans]MBD1224387.1 FbpB family small basic protein [Virgibacillus halodenitrificans]MCG1029820.1 FbpB family small basic protein [Virgibacillus halodenitrificans]MCJ0931377.1 FbpB family small basic protein [Virgibacillus halodenitrificans]MEC2159081.1 FbpB family small basic protein [Virgibacillus halodenitrificans]MYL47438.1 FbpB family small basic protein [Virgibacillus halodenitrificans]
MRPKTLNFEQLVKENKQELLRNEKEVMQLEMRLEAKQAAMVEKKRNKV